MSKQLFKRNQAVAVVAGVATAPVWKSLHNFDGISLLAPGVAQYLNNYNPAQVMRVKYGTAYIVTLRGMLVKPGGFAVGGSAFTLLETWRPTAGRISFAVTGHEATRGRLDVLTNGNVVNVVGGSYLDLNGVSFWTN